jgi:hypothetical protein
LVVVKVIEREEVVRAILMLIVKVFEWRCGREEEEGERAKPKYL